MMSKDLENALIIRQLKDPNHLATMPVLSAVNILCCLLNVVRMLKCFCVSKEACLKCKPTYMQPLTIKFIV